MFFTDAHPDYRRTINPNACFGFFGFYDQSIALLAYASCAAQYFCLHVLLC